MMDDARSDIGIYLERTRQEVRQVRDAGFLLAGHAYGAVLLVKGDLGPAECSGAQLLSGPDGQALVAALGRLGYTDDAWAACSSVVRVGDGWEDALPQDLAWAVEVFDPELVIALDGAAARGLARGWTLDQPLAPGAVTRVRGRRVLALDGFERALVDPQAKQRMWAWLKQVPPLAAPL